MLILFGGLLVPKFNRYSVGVPPDAGAVHVKLAVLQVNNEAFAGDVYVAQAGTLGVTQVMASE